MQFSIGVTRVVRFFRCKTGHDENTATCSALGASHELIDGVRCGCC